MRRDPIDPDRPVYTSARRRYGDIASRIRDLEAHLIRQLEARILRELPLLRARPPEISRRDLLLPRPRADRRVHVAVTVQSVLADLDALLALAACARDFGFARPVISAEQTSVRIKQGWHPLLRLVVSQAVPNDFSLGEGGGRLVLLTGPNASGKTVYLRTAAIIVFLAQIGSFVPGARSRVKTPARMREWRSRETVCGAQPRALSSVYPTRSTRA